jgi:hypothetical protein
MEEKGADILGGAIDERCRGNERVRAAGASNLVETQGRLRCLMQMSTWLGGSSRNSSIFQSPCKESSDTHEYYARTTLLTI